MLKDKLWTFIINPKFLIGLIGLEILGLFIYCCQYYHLLFYFLLFIPCYYFEKYKNVYLRYKISWFVLFACLLIEELPYFYTLKHASNIEKEINLHLMSTLIFGFFIYFLYFIFKYVKISFPKWFYNYSVMLLLFVIGGGVVLWELFNLRPWFLAKNNLYTLKDYMLVYRNTLCSALGVSGLIVLVMNWFRDKYSLQKMVIKLSALIYLMAPLCIYIVIIIVFSRYPVKAIFDRFPAYIFSWITVIWIFGFPVLVGCCMALWGCFICLMSKKMSFYVIGSVLGILSILLMVNSDKPLVEYPFNKVYGNW